MMKKTLMIISLSTTLLLAGLSYISAQEQPKPQKDTVNMDTQAKPAFYYATEDEKSTPEKRSGNNTAVTIAIIAGAVVLVGAAVFFLMKKKKQ